MTTDLPTVHQLMGEVMREVGAVGKDRRNEQQEYKFRGIDDFMNALHPVMAKHGIFLVPEVKERHTEIRERTRNNQVVGVTVHQMLMVAFHFYGPKGDCVTAITFGEASDTADKAGNKAMSAALKYAIMQTFLIPTEDLIDGDSETPEMGEVAPRRGGSAPPSQPSPPAEPAEQSFLDRMIAAGWETGMINEGTEPAVREALEWRKAIKAVDRAFADKLDAEAKRAGAKALLDPANFRVINRMRAEYMQAFSTEAQAALEGALAGHLTVERFEEMSKASGWAELWHDFTPAMVGEFRKFMEDLKLEPF